MVSGAAHRTSTSYPSPPCLPRTMLKSLAVSARTSTRNIAFIFNASALQPRLAHMRTAFNACFPEHTGQSCSCSPWTRYLALSKLERNSDRDREDVLRLARAGYIDCGVLKARYLEEVRPYLLNKHEWHDQTLELWKIGRASCRERV